MFSETADDSIDSFFEDRFGFKFVDGSRSGSARLDGVVIVVVVVMVMAGFSGQRAARAASGGCGCHPRLVWPALDGFRTVDDCAATSRTTRSGWCWPSGLVMLHHRITG